MNLYISVITTNSNLYNLLDTIFYNIAFKKETNYLISLNDNNCIAIIWDINSFEFNEVDKNISKPIILLSSLPNNLTNYIKLHNLNFVKQEYNDLIRLNTDTFFLLKNIAF